MRSRKKVSPVQWGARLASIVVMLALLAGPMGVLTGLPAHAADPVWRGEYYNNTWLGGTPALVRDDAEINFDWGTASPGPGVNAENFSTRWTRSVYFDEANYQFTVTTDDGVRVWIDGDLVLDKWFDQAPTTYNFTRAMGVGEHYIRMEHYEHTGFAVARLSWVKLDGGPDQWHGEFYPNMYLSGPPLLVRDDPILGFNWGPNSPGDPISPDYFSVRWTRVVTFGAGGTYTFYATHDDGMRVWVDERLIIDKWYPQPETTHTASMYLGAGDHRIRVEYYEQTGMAVAMLRWELSGPPAPPPPPPGPVEIIVDEYSPGFLLGGPVSGWRNTTCGYSGHAYWTLNSTYQVFNYGRWTPALPQAGQYTVYAFIPRCNATTRSARYRIYHAGQRHDVWVDQSRYYDAWVRLGTFTFNATGGEYVYMSDNTHEAYLSRKIGFDAVKFVLAEPAPPACAITPQFGFGRVWNTYGTVRAKLGCPLNEEVSVAGAEEIFIGGYMFWLSSGPTVYVLYNNGTWQSYPDTWAPPQPESDPSIVPPWGYYQPVRGFGKVWRENAGVRTGLSWATEPERGLDLSWQDFQGGHMLWSNRLGIFVLYSDGSWQHYD